MEPACDALVSHVSESMEGNRTEARLGCAFLAMVTHYPPNAVLIGVDLTTPVAADGELTHRQLAGHPYSARNATSG
jgi:hypothetical protein